MGDIDREEKDLLRTYELDEWQPVADRDAEIDRYRRYARATFGKEERVNILSPAMIWRPSKGRRLSREYPVKHSCRTSYTGTRAVG